MTWFEKADIVLFTYNLPLTAIFAFFIFLNLTVAPLLFIDLGRVYSVWMLIPTVIFFFSPMLNDFITWTFRLNPLRNLVYAVCVIMLYGSMLTTSLISATMGFFGKKAKFIVTPKNSQKVGLGFAFRLQWKELLFSTLLLGISLLFHRGFLPVLLIVITGYASFILPFFSNVRYSESQTEREDQKTAKISMEQNEIFLYTNRVERGSGKNAVKPPKRTPLSDI